MQDMLGHAGIVLTAGTYSSVLPTLARQFAKATAKPVLDAAANTGAPRRRRHTYPLASDNVDLVDLTHQHTNREVLVEGPEITIRPVGTRRLAVGGSQ